MATLHSNGHPRLYIKHANQKIDQVAWTQKSSPSHNLMCYRLWGETKELSNLSLKINYAENPTAATGCPLKVR